EIEQLFERESFSFDTALESVAVEELHGDEALAVFLADFVDRTNVRMIQSGSGLGFAFKARQGLRIAGDFGGEEFQGHETVEFDVFGFIDDTHPATAELFEDSI